MHYYKYQGHYLFSINEYPSFQSVSEEEISKANEILYFLIPLDREKSRRSFAISDPALLCLERESLELLVKRDAGKGKLPFWIIEKINSGKIKAINTEYPNWEKSLKNNLPKAWRINVVGLGDVGSTLLMGLKLLGDSKVSQIGIFDIDEKKLARWEFECNQILFPNGQPSPRILPIMQQDLFDCDMFVFCVTVGIPDIDSKGIDVRMAQFEGNSKIISIYAKQARQCGFKGIFAVVSDPVDLLCKKALIESNTNEAGEYDYMGLAPEQIRGYGLGVMHARAAYYAAKQPDSIHYLAEGRAFGPHGQHLVIADSMEGYNEELSLKLTEKARTANMELREHGFKPYVAPALSSGAISLIETISGSWHYSATYMGGVYMGARNKLTAAGTVIEQYNMPPQLIARLHNSYKELESII